jgi:class 3 adenylate cyclase/tetratricopeptide (TPR) repeat protein
VALELVCSSCGAANEHGDRFCGACGAGLIGGPAPATASERTPGSSVVNGPGGVAERRLVSVLFADLVGFTTLSEHRDPEEVRELLSDYFDRCRTLIERYGGTVGKFIGDAVMAVWGTPVAREDDPERAVRAGLALTQAVAELAGEIDMPDLRVRVGVLTGTAAVDVGAEAEGMVLGDSVNTASRLQSIAAPGTVLVDDVTRRASEAAIAYEDAGTHEVKGREQPVHAWTALRVVAGAGGARRSAGLEAPFVGRDTELRAIIDAVDDSAARSCARHVAVLGEAGSGKSRLVWELFKYVDGVQDNRYWHHGRCLSYGEGVAYWALAEMVRTRAGILEEDEPGEAREKLHLAVEQFVDDDRERRLVEPRLLHLLRLAERADADRADLFSGWRLFFERLSQHWPVVLVFEDLQWADSGLLDFIDYLLEWSADFPIIVLTLARPELRERRPSWEPLTLYPLASDAVTTILEGMAPGLPRELVADIVHRAEGIPLYAVETIRMLQDRGLLVQEGARYVVTGDISDLDVPETMQALVASRLDGLSAGERSLLQDASVLGQSFTAAAAAAVSGRPEPEVKLVLDQLLTKQVLTRDDDPRSPERGQYHYLQALLRTVAYGTLSRRARKARHLAAAQHLEGSWPGELRDIAEVLASHYQEAIRADPEAPDVAELRAAARQRLTAAGRAAASLVLGPEAMRYFQQAAEMADDDLEQAQLFEQAGRALRDSGDVHGAESLLRSAIELYERSSRTSGGSARVALAEALLPAGRPDEARELLEVFLSAESPTGDEALRAEALAELGRVLILSGEIDLAGPMLEEALTTLERRQAWAALATALITRAVYLVHKQRREEGFGILHHALTLAERHGLPRVALRARYNLAAISLENDQFTEAVEELREGLNLARERGDRAFERQLFGQIIVPLTTLGRWDEAAPIGTTLVAGKLDVDSSWGATFLALIAGARGDDEILAECLRIAHEVRDSTYVDQRMSAHVTLARDAVGRDAPDEALRLAGEVIGQPNTASELFEAAYAVGLEAAITLGEESRITELVQFVDELPPARATPLLRAGRARLAAELAHRAGDPPARAAHEAEAFKLLRSVGARPLLARALLDRGRRSDDAEALNEARAICADLRASRWMLEIDRVRGVTA